MTGHFHTRSLLRPVPTVDPALLLGDSLITAVFFPPLPSSLAWHGTGCHLPLPLEPHIATYCLLSKQSGTVPSSVPLLPSRTPRLFQAFPLPSLQGLLRTKALTWKPGPAPLVLEGPPPLAPPLGAAAVPTVCVHGAASLGQVPPLQAMMHQVPLGPRGKGAAHEALVYLRSLPKMCFQQCPSPDLQFKFRFHEEPFLGPGLIDSNWSPSTRVLHRPVLRPRGRASSYQDSQ